MEHAFLNIALLFQFVYAAMIDPHAKDKEVALILRTQMYLQARMCSDKMIQHPDSWPASVMAIGCTKYLCDDHTGGYRSSVDTPDSVKC